MAGTVKEREKDVRKDEWEREINERANINPACEMRNWVFLVAETEKIACIS